MISIKLFNAMLQVESNERRSRRDMSPQGRKRASAMVARDCRTVSGIGQSYYSNQQVCVTIQMLVHYDGCSWYYSNLCIELRLILLFHILTALWLLLKNGFVIKLIQVNAITVTPNNSSKGSYMRH